MSKERLKDQRNRPIQKTGSVPNLRMFSVSTAKDNTLAPLRFPIKSRAKEAKQSLLKVVLIPTTPTNLPRKQHSNRLTVLYRASTGKLMRRLTDSPSFYCNYFSIKAAQTHQVFPELLVETKLFRLSRSVLSP